MCWVVVVKLMFHLEPALIVGPDVDAAAATGPDADAAAPTGGRFGGAYGWGRACGGDVKEVLAWACLW